MTKNITIFYAHSSYDTEDHINKACKKIKELIRARGERAGKDLKVTIVPGRDDFRVHHRGDWNSWAKSVTNREHSITRKPYYDMIVIPTPYVGRATAQVVGMAIRVGRPVFLLCQHEERGDAPEIQRITQVYPYDEEDWAGGYRCDPDPQLKLPLKEKSNASPND
tara:strand:+ start:17160 stop:17654 length:495 start_codon:yes stop_codon:yes gene_type:complete